METLVDSRITPTNQSSGVYVEKTPPEARRAQAANRSHIQGWGADLDRANRPAVPKERTPPRLQVPWDAPELQHSKVKVYHSVERPGVTPVYGTSTPPSGLSGKMRDLAYKYAENDLRHWLILLLADRVNVGEGLLQDLAHGHIPNVYREMGGPAELRYNRAGFVRKAAATTVVLGLAYVWMRRRGHRG